MREVLAARARAAVGRLDMPREIATERLTLRQLRLDDFAAFAAFYADAQASMMIGGPQGRGAAWMRFAALAGQWSLHGFGHYALADRDGAFCGCVGLWFPAERPEIELAYTVFPQAQGNGYATEAARAIMAIAIAAGLPSLVSYIDADNVASRQMAMGLGASREGVIASGERHVEVWRYELCQDVLTGDPEPVLLEATVMPLTIRTSRLSLAQWRPQHFEAYAAHQSDAASMTYVGGVRDRAKAWRAMASEAGQWQLLGYGMYAVEADDGFVGTVGIFHPAHWPERELAYEIFAAHRRKGYAAEAARAVREVAIEQGLSRLVSFIHPDNVASIAVAQKLGCRHATDIAGANDAAVWEHPMQPDGGRRIAEAA